MKETTKGVLYAITSFSGWVISHETVNLYMESLVLVLSLTAGALSFYKFMVNKGKPKPKDD